MAQKSTKKLILPNHLYWYLFADSETPVKIKEGELPTPPYVRYETKGECLSHVMTDIHGYCCGAKDIKDSGCPKRFDCQLYREFHILAGTGKFKKMYMGDIFKNAPYTTIGADKEFYCKSFKERENV